MKATKVGNQDDSKDNSMRAGVVHVSPKDQYFELRCQFYPLERYVGRKQRISSYGYLTQEDAVEQSSLFQFAVHVDGAKNWQSPAQLRKIGAELRRSGAELELRRSEYAERFDKRVRERVDPKYLTARTDLLTSRLEVESAALGFLRQRMMTGQSYKMVVRPMEHFREGPGRDEGRVTAG